MMPQKKTSSSKSSASCSVMGTEG